MATKTATKKVKVTLGRAEAIRFLDAAEMAMDGFDNGTETMNSLRRLVSVLVKAINEAR